MLIKLKKNPGLRSLAKYCLNSLWGKFEQRCNLKQTEIIKTCEALLKLLVEPEKAVFDVLSVNENLLYANWGYIEDAVEPARSSCVVLAAYTTAQARLEIYNYIEKLIAARVLYMDTDSCIFKCDGNNPNEYRPALCSSLGNMTDELKAYGAGTFITDFLSGETKILCLSSLCPFDRRDCRVL